MESRKIILKYLFITQQRDTDMRTDLWARAGRVNGETWKHRHSQV